MRTVFFACLAIFLMQPLRAGANQALAKIANRDNANFRARVFLFDLLE